MVFCKTQRSDGVLGWRWRQTNEERKTKKFLSGQSEGVITNNSPNQCLDLFISLCLFNTNITVLLKKQ